MSEERGCIPVLPWSKWPYVDSTNEPYIIKTWCGREIKKWRGLQRHESVWKNIDTALRVSSGAAATVPGDALFRSAVRVVTFCLNHS